MGEEDARHAAGAQLAPQLVALAHQVSGLEAHGRASMAARITWAAIGAATVPPSLGVSSTTTATATAGSSAARSR